MARIKFQIVGFLVLLSVAWSTQNFLGPTLNNKILDEIFRSLSNIEGIVQRLAKCGGRGKQPVLSTTSVCSTLVSMLDLACPPPNQSSPRVSLFRDLKSPVQKYSPPLSDPTVQFSETNQTTRTQISPKILSRLRASLLPEQVPIKLSTNNNRDVNPENNEIGKTVDDIEDLEPTSDADLNEGWIQDIDSTIDINDGYDNNNGNVNSNSNTNKVDRLGTRPRIPIHIPKLQISKELRDTIRQYYPRQFSPTQIPGHLSSGSRSLNRNRNVNTNINTNQNSFQGGDDLLGDF